MQAGDRISGSCMRPRLRPRLRVANHQKWEMTQERVPSELQIGSSGPDAAVFQFQTVTSVDLFDGEDYMNQPAPALEWPGTCSGDVWAIFCPFWAQAGLDQIQPIWDHGDALWTANLQFRAKGDRHRDSTWSRNPSKGPRNLNEVFHFFCTTVLVSVAACLLDAFARCVGPPRWS